MAASNEDFTISGFTLSLQGGGNWIANTTGLEVLLDDGDGVLNAGDTSLFTGTAGGATMTCNFGGNVTIAQGTSEDFWVVLDVAATAGGSPAEEFQASIAATGDVQVVTAGGQVLFGTTPPTGGLLRVVTFTVTNVSPVTGSSNGGTALTITGSGFAAPVTLTINGVPCTGTAVVSVDGTSITGLITPAGLGTNRAMVLTTNSLPPQTLTQTFTYVSAFTPGSGSGGGGGGGGGGCAAGAPAGGLIALFGLVAVAMRRRRK